MIYELGRFVWWFQHEPNAPATFVQAVASLFTVAITGVLGWVRTLELCSLERTGRGENAW